MPAPLILYSDESYDRSAGQTAPFARLGVLCPEDMAGALQGIELN